MNHDVTYCADYKKSKCPKHCYRAQLTQELRETLRPFWLPISWAHFEGTQYCAKTNKGEQHGEQHGEPNDI